MLINLSGGCRCGAVQSYIEAVRNYTRRFGSTVAAGFRQLRAIFCKSKPKMPQKCPTLSQLQHFFFKSLAASLII
jgi:hypothetical protein